MFSELVDLLYAAATEPAGWTPFLGQLARATDSEVVFFLAHDTASHAGSGLWTFGASAEAAREYVAWAPENVVIKAAAPLLRSGAVFPNSPAPRGEFHRSRYYNEFVKPFAGSVGDLCGACIVYEMPASVNLSCSRLLAKPDYGPDEHALISALVPHLQRAFSIQRRLGQAEIESASSAAVLDGLACGVMFLDERGKTILFNRAARAMLDANDGLVLSAHGDVGASRPGDHATLRRLVRAACETGNGAAENPGGAVRVHRPSDKRPYAVIVAPLRLRQWPLLSQRPVAVVFVTDPEQEWDGTCQLAELYGLTPAEARVASLLASGNRVADIVDLLRVSTPTVRTHVRRLIDKTDARGQADLVRMLLLSLAGQAGEPRSPQASPVTLRSEHGDR